MSLPPNSKIGMIAGSGTLPDRLIAACRESDQDIFVVYLNQSDADTAHHKAEHVVLRMGAVGKALKFFREHGVTHLVLAGKVTKPSFTSIRPDGAGVRLLARITAAHFKGDDAVLSAVVKFFEEAGFAIIGAEQIVEDLLMPSGILGKHTPDNVANKDIDLGMLVAHTVGNLDIGQSVVVQNGVILGVEGPEGTDALILRCATLQKEGRGAVLVKMKKPKQDKRVDLPTVGLTTLENLRSCGYAGMAVEAGGALMLDRHELVERADALGLFVVGV